MGNACVRDTRKNKPVIDMDTITTTKRSIISPHQTRQESTKFTFMLNDEEILISPESSSTITPKPIIKGSNENPLDLWLKKLSISPRSIFNDKYDKHATFNSDQGELSVSKDNHEDNSYNTHQLEISTIQTPVRDTNDDRNANSTTNTDGSDNANLRQNHDDKATHSQIDTTMARSPIIPDNKPVMSTTGTTSSTLSTLSSPRGEAQVNLYRETTATIWDVSDIEALAEEMKMEMESMQTQTQTQSKSGSIVPPTMHARDSSSTATGSHAKISAFSTSIALGTVDILREDVSTDHDQDFESLMSKDKISYEDLAMLMSKNKERTFPKSASLFVNHAPTNTMDTLRFEADHDLLNVPNDDEVERRGSNLVQTESCDWDSDELEKEEIGIKKQIKHLRSKSKSKSKSKVKSVAKDANLNLNEYNTMNEDVDNL